MEQQHLYEKVIGQKLNGVTAACEKQVWPLLEQKLDKLMPQQEEETDKQQGPRLLKHTMLVAAGLFATAAGIYTLRLVAGKNPGSEVRIAVINCPFALYSDSLLTVASG
ncbi:MAG TPA: hypothetical protein VEX65_00925 [Flavisolibacter sp.]|nr:hypothetical protein [Flavisolibacter sp.]